MYSSLSLSLYIGQEHPVCVNKFQDTVIEARIHRSWDLGLIDVVPVDGCLQTEWCYCIGEWI